jgi:hypothetical protein
MLPTGVLPNLSRNNHRTHAKRPAANTPLREVGTEDVRVQRKLAV